MPVIIPNAEHIGHHQHRQQYTAGRLAAENVCQQRYGQHTSTVNACLGHSGKNCYQQDEYKVSVGKLIRKE